MAAGVLFSRGDRVCRKGTCNLNLIAALPETGPHRRGLAGGRRRAAARESYKLTRNWVLQSRTGNIPQRRISSRLVVLYIKNQIISKLTSNIRMDTMHYLSSILHVRVALYSTVDRASNRGPDDSPDQPRLGQLKACW